jgi:transposase
MLKPDKDPGIPEMTRLIAREAFPQGNIFLTMRDELGPIFEDEQFRDLYPALGQPAVSPARLALVTVMQFVENLTDRQAALAVRARIDWKYALGLELSDPGFNYSILSEFRSRLIEGGVEQLLLEKILERCEVRGLLGGKKKQRTDSTHVMAAIRALNLLELVGETMRRTLDAIAEIAPEWLTSHMQPEWVKRYGRRFENYRLPNTEQQRQELAETIGQDGYYLLECIYQKETPLEIRQLPAVEIMRRIWIQQYYRDDGGMHWRTKKKWGQPAAGQMIASPDDPQAHYCVKRSTEWTGYKVHLTETCQEGHPHLITQVETTASTTHDVKMTGKIQDELEKRDLLPEVMIVDEGYMEIDRLVSSQERGIDLIGPVPSSKSWQDREEGAFDHTQFQIDWERLVATCPNGKESARATSRKTWRGTPNLNFPFSKNDCLPCGLRNYCSRAKNTGRTLTIYPQQKYEALLQARQRQKTEAFREVYGQRAGIEGTFSQGVRTLGLRRSRYLGLARTRLQHVAISAAINIVRVFSWLSGERPIHSTRTPFLKLAMSL